MTHTIRSAPSRRSFLAGSAAGSAGLLLGLRPLPAVTPGLRNVVLKAAPTRTRLVPEPYDETDAWAYNGIVPGPEIRVRQGERLRVTVDNGLAEGTTVHWHGVRLPHAMDGVPYLTQPPIEPGERFIYEFDAVDAGTFWYHPHMRSAEQVGRGLYGPLIVGEPEPPRVDREVTWVLDDWRLTEAAEIAGDFGNMHDVSHNGRIGNTVTINGRVPASTQVRSGERIRLRLINAANARIFGLDFQGHAPVVIALDGQPVEPHTPEGRLVILGPAMRADLILDLGLAPGETASVIDRFYRELEFRLIDLAYAPERLRPEPPDWPMALPPNPIPEPDLAGAERHEIILNGGMMGQMVMAEMGGSMGGAGGMMGMMHGDAIWFINGRAAEGHILDPMLTLAQGQSHVLAMSNATAWHHPMHLHGHSFRVISRNGIPTPRREWQDTVLLAPRETVEVAFVADNPGDWMFHCHILEHQEAGMMGVIRVA